MKNGYKLMGGFYSSNPSQGTRFNSRTELPKFNTAQSNTQTGLASASIHTRLKLTRKYATYSRWRIQSERHQRSSDPNSSFTSPFMASCF